jgi:hypothetical protein
MLKGGARVKGVRFGGGSGVGWDTLETSSGNYRFPRYRRWL